MELKMYRTLWGITEPSLSFLSSLPSYGYCGVEGRIPATQDERVIFKRHLSEADLEYIGIIFTGKGVIPDQSLTPEQHLDHLEDQLNHAKFLGAKFVNVLAGNDRWPLATQVAFFKKAHQLSQDMGLICSFETHRGTSLYSPWVTLEILRSVPDMKFTMDISHWFLVCERLLDQKEDDLDEFFQRVFHIQARVGYDQGAQVPHPAAPEYKKFLSFHQLLWEKVWRYQMQKQRAYTTMTTEFGPDGYLHHLPFTDVPVADLNQLNLWMAEEEHKHFQSFSETAKQGGIVYEYE